MEPMKSVEDVRVYMKSLGIDEEDFRIGVSSEDYPEKWEITFKLPMAKMELPDELKPFEDVETDIERFMWKGNSPKESLFGTVFYLALCHYQGKILTDSGEYNKYHDEERMSQIKSTEELDLYEKEWNDVAERILAAHPTFSKLEKELEKLP